MKILLTVLYWIEGISIAVAASCAIGFLLCTVIAVTRIVKRKQNIGIAAMYLGCTIMCLLYIWGGVFFAGWLGDKTTGAGQQALVWGALFPGIFSLAVIPQFLGVAMKQTLGIEVS
jgi:hypothetical protein